MTPQLTNWFSKLWLDRVMRGRLAGEYSALKSSPRMLADMAARNFVLAALPDDPQQMAIAEGRRRAMLEMLELARIDPAEFANFKIPTKPQGE